MADNTEEIPSYVEKFRLINEPTNHWKARKTFLVNNWNDYAETQLVSLSMVWANMQFDGCRYASALMDRVHGMAQGISVSDADGDTETSHGSHTRPSGKPISESAIKRPRMSTENSESVSDVGSLECAKDVSGNPINISQNSLAFQMYPTPLLASNNQFGVEKLCDLFQTSKSMCQKKTIEPSQVRSLFAGRLYALTPDLKYDIRCIDQKEKHNPKWKAYVLFRDTLCVTYVGSSKKLAKDGAVYSLLNLIKDHKIIGLMRCSSREHVEVGAAHEVVFLEPVAKETSIRSQKSQDQGEGSTAGIPSLVEVVEQKPFTAENIVASLPREFAMHKLNRNITAAPKIPNFFLVEFVKEKEKYGYENPVSKLVNSASMCKVPLNFLTDKFTSRSGLAGQISTVVLGPHTVGTGLALGVREAKHLACYNAIQALQMTNATIRKSDKFDRPKVSRDELTDGPGSAAEEVVPETNVGHKMLKMMGWKGAGVGLGKKEEGIANPVQAKGKSTQVKDGLGFDLLDIHDPNTKSLDEQKVLQILQDYARSDREEELVFTSELNLNERKKLHEMCNRVGLKSKSKGKGTTRYLVVGRRWDITLLAKSVAERGGNTGNYQLVGPMFDSGE